MIIKYQEQQLQITMACRVVHAHNQMILKISHCDINCIFRDVSQELHSRKQNNAKN